MALFVLVLVGLVVARTWMDWRETRRELVIPEWAKGVALAAVVAVSLAAATSFASVWLEDGGQISGGIGSNTFWVEFAFLLSVLGAIVFAARKKKLRFAIIITGIALAAIFWVGMTLFS